MKTNLKEFESKEESKIEDFKIIGSEKRPPLDLSDLIGKRAKIEGIEKKRGKYGPYLVLKTGIVGKKVFGEKEIEFKASKILPLAINKDGEVIWIEDSKTDLFLKKMKVSDPESLWGLEVVIQLTEPNQEGNQFLTF